MKALVAVKRVVDANVKVRVKPDNTGVDLTNVKMSINPFCEIAVEEAVRLKEKGTVSEIVVVSVGSKDAQEQIRSAMALGADRGILVETADEIGALEVAKILKGVVDAEKPELILLGKQAIDDDSNQVGQMLGALLGAGQGTFASEVKVDGGKVQVTREVDGGLQTVELGLPATADYGVATGTKLKTIKVEAPAERKAGVQVKSVDELVEKLKNEAKVI